MGGTARGGRGGGRGVREEKLCGPGLPKVYKYCTQARPPILFHEPMNHRPNIIVAICTANQLRRARTVLAAGEIAGNLAPCCQSRSGVFLFS
jgi:glucokinase